MKDWTILACHVYNNKYYNVMTITYCDIQFEDDVAETLSRKKNYIMIENGVANMNVKCFMVDIAHAN